MFRRLHFLVPDAQHAKSIVNDLLKLGVDANRIHTYAEHNQKLEGLNPATRNQAHDKSAILEKIFWNANLVLFFTMAAILVMAIFTSRPMLALFCLAIMLICFAIGNFFASYIPHTHLQEFKHALSHNEMLMMVDVPDEKVAEIENKVHRHHPAAIDGGSSWTLKSVDI